MNRVKQNILSREKQDEIVVNNIDIAEKESRRFATRYYSTGISYEEFLSAANEGLIEGAKRYDPSKGKDRNYVRWWIKAYIYKILYERKVIHTPWNKIDKILNARKKDSLKSLSFPIPQVVSLDLNYDIDDSKNYPRRGPAGCNRNWDRYVLEYEAIISISGNDTDFNAKSDLKNHIEYALEKSSLSSIERDTIIHRFGLMGNEPKTLQEIASLSGYTSMGIKKVENRALNKLKKMDLIKELRR